VFTALGGIEPGDIGYGNRVSLDYFRKKEFVHAGAKGLYPTQIGSGGADGRREVAHNDLDFARQSNRLGFVGGDQDLVIAILARPLPKLLVLLVAE
jgi:hypothetical protein